MNEIKTMAGLNFDFLKAVDIESEDLTFTESEQVCPRHGPYTARTYSDGFVSDCPKCTDERIAERQRLALEAEQKKIEERESARKREKHIEYCKSLNISPEFYFATLDDYIPKTRGQEEAKKATATLIEKKRGKVILLGSNGVGKEEWVEQIIPTPQGFRRFGDLSIGDYVYDETGKPTKILGVFPQGIKDSYKVTFTDGRSDECGLEHLWGVYTKSHGKWKYQVLTLNEMLKKGITNNKGSVRFHIPSSPVIECEEKQLPCDPYILGSFIGNGCCTCTYLSLSSNDEWQVKKCADILGCTLQRNTATYTWYFKKGKKVRTDEILPKEVCCYASEKRIPNEYMFASASQRQALLQGLFDTDGHAGAYGTRLHVSYSTTSKELAKDIQTLLLTFGIVSHIGEDTRKKHISFYLSVNCSVEKAAMLFSLPRKLEKVLNPNVKKGSHRDYSKVGIKKVEKVSEKKEMMCIWVENENHLYLTKDYLVTHNTMLASIACMALGGHIYTMYEMATMIRQSYTAKAEKSELEIVRGFINLPFLVIDEAGRVSASEAVLNWFSFILDQRHSLGLPTWINGNLHFKKDCAEKGCPRCFENYFDKDMLSRFHEDTTVINIKAKDGRTEKKSFKYFSD